MASHPNVIDFRVISFVNEPLFYAVKLVNAKQIFEGWQFQFLVKVNKGSHGPSLPSRVHVD